MNGHRGKPTALGFASGLVAGPSRSRRNRYVTPLSAIVIGLIAGSCATWSLASNRISATTIPRRIWRPRRRRFLARADRRLCVASALQSRAGNPETDVGQTGDGRAPRSRPNSSPLDPPPMLLSRPLSWSKSSTRCSAFASSACGRGRTGPQPARRSRLRPAACPGMAPGGPRPGAACRVGAAQWPKRFTVVIDGVPSQDLMNAWTELCQVHAEPPHRPSRNPPYVTTVQGNRFRFRGGASAMSENLQRLFSERLAGKPVKTRRELGEW